MVKKDFPIFHNNPDLIYLDSTASSQKPQFVIEGISKYLENSYSNIHRGLYDISMTSEKIYFESKKKVAKYLGVKDFQEIIYTYNANYALNILAQTLRISDFFKPGDKVLLSIVEHHSNIVPWLILQQEIGIEIDFIALDENYNIDFGDFEKKFDERVKVVSLTHVSNVTGQIFDVEKIGSLIKERYSKKANLQKPLFILDASQSFPHFALDVEKIGCDFLFFTGHKIMADSGIGVLWGKRKYLESFSPIFSGGGAINQVKQCSFTPGALPYKFEPGTPNITGAVSLLKALEYIENIGGFEKIEEIEAPLVEYALKEFHKRPKIKIIGSDDASQRVGVFSFVIDGVHPLDIADMMAENNIALRAGQHCTEPFMDSLGVHATSRMSLYIYNTYEDIDAFFQVLDDNFL